MPRGSRRAVIRRKSRRGKSNVGRDLGRWFTNQVWNTSLLWLLGFFAAGVVFYAMTTSTLKTHSEDLATLKASFAENKKEEAGSRERVREAFLADSKATAAGIAELNKTTAVMGATLLGVQKELEKIGAKLDNPPVIRR